MKPTFRTTNKTSLILFGKSDILWAGLYSEHKTGFDPLNRFTTSFKEVVIRPQCRIIALFMADKAMIKHKKQYF